MYCNLFNQSPVKELFPFMIVSSAVLYILVDASFCACASVLQDKSVEVESLDQSV